MSNKFGILLSASAIALAGCSDNTEKPAKVLRSTQADVQKLVCPDPKNAVGCTLYAEFIAPDGNGIVVTNTMRHTLKNVNITGNKLTLNYDILYDNLKDGKSVLMAPYKADGIVVYTLNDSELTSLDISGIFQGHFAKTIQKFKDAKPRKTQ